MTDRNTIYFGVGATQTSAATTTIPLYDDVYLYPIRVNCNTTLAFDTSNLDPEKTAQGSDWGYQILLQITMPNTLYTVTFPNGVIWDRGAVPVLNKSQSTYYVRLEFVDGEIFGCFEGMEIGLQR